MKIWRVTTKLFKLPDSSGYEGDADVRVDEERCDRMPENGFSDAAGYCVYMDYFTDRKAAEEFAECARLPE